MSEETEPSQDKQSKIKLKLKKMGVLREDGDSPAQNKQSFWRSKLPVIIVVLLAVGFWWWYSSSQHTETTTVAENTPPSMPAYPPGYGPQPQMPPESGADWQTMQQSDQAAGDTMPPGPGWGGPGNRYDDRFGPPPGWGQGFQPPPPPPGFYGRPYYGPPPPYYPQPYNGYYGPPPPPGYWR